MPPLGGKATLRTVVIPPKSLLADDLNGDGRLDLVWSMQAGASVTYAYAFGDSAGGLTPTQQIVGDAGGSAMAAGDLRPVCASSKCPRT